MRNAELVSPPDPSGTGTGVGSSGSPVPRAVARAARGGRPCRSPHRAGRPRGRRIRHERRSARRAVSVGREPSHSPAREVVECAPVPPLLDHGGAHVGRASDRRRVAELLSERRRCEDPPLVGRRLGRSAVGKTARCRQRASPGAGVLRTVDQSDGDGARPLPFVGPEREVTVERPAEVGEQLAEPHEPVVLLALPLGPLLGVVEVLPPAGSVEALRLQLRPGLGGIQTSRQAGRMRAPRCAAADRPRPVRRGCPRIETLACCRAAATPRAAPPRAPSRRGHGSGIPTVAGWPNRCAVRRSETRGRGVKQRTWTNPANRRRFPRAGSGYSVRATSNGPAPPRPAEWKQKG